jgi:hypothetical protein
VTRRRLGFSAKDETHVERASSKMQFKRGETVRELVHQACQLWAVAPGSAVLSARGALVSDRTPLIELWRAYGGGGVADFGGARALGWGGGSPLPSPSVARLAHSYAALGANSPAIAASAEAAAQVAAAPVVELLVVPPRKRSKAAAKSAETSAAGAGESRSATRAAKQLEGELDSLEVSLGVSPLTLSLWRSARCALLVELALAVMLFGVQLLITVSYLNKLAVEGSYNAALESLVKTTNLFFDNKTQTYLAFDFESIAISGEIFAWLRTTFRDFLFTSLLKTAQATNSSISKTWTLEAGESVLIGELQFQQLRVRANVSCSINAQLRNIADGCFSPWSREAQDVSSFGKLYSPGFEYWSPDVIQDAFGPELSSAMLRGQISAYPTDGFIANVGRQWQGQPKDKNISELIAAYDQMLESLSNDGWVDEQTSAIMVSFNSVTTGSSSTFDSSVIVGNTLLFEQDPGSGFLTSSHSVAVIEPRPFKSVVNFGLAVLLIGTLALLAWSAVRAARSGDHYIKFSRPWWARPCLYLDLLLLVLVILELAYMIEAENISQQCIAVISAQRSRYVPLQSLFSSELVLGSILPVLVVLMFARVFVGLQLFQTGALLLNAADRLSRSLLIISLLYFFMVTAVALILGQVLFNEGWFSSWPSTFVLLSASVDELMSTFRVELNEPAQTSRFVRWYSFLWMYGHLFAVRVCFSAFACAFGIYHIALAVAEHKSGLKHVAELRKLRAADAGRTFQDAQEEAELS